MKRPPIGIDETPSSTRQTAAANTGPAALLDDLELTAQRNLALARLNASPLPPIQTAANVAGPGGPVPTEQSLYSHLYGKEMGLMRKLTTSLDDYPASVAARNYQQLLQQQQQQQQHPDSGAGHHHQQQQQMQQNFPPKFNQFNYPNPGGLLKPCYDYSASQQQHQMQPGSTAGGTAAPTPNQQMKKEMFNLSGTNGVDLYSPSPAPATTSSASAAATPSSMANGAGFMNLHQPSAAAAAAAAAAAMYANHFNNGVGPNGANKLDNNGGDGGLVDFNAAMRPGANTNKSGSTASNLIKSAESVLMARSSIMNNLNNNLNKIEPNTDTTLNDSNNNNNNNSHHHHHQQQQHLVGGFHGNGAAGTGGDDDMDKLSSPMTGTSTLTNTDLNDPENDDADDGYTIL